MSNFCNTELCASVESKATEITSADTASDLLLTTFLTDKLATNRTSKIDYSNLPDANTVPNGHLVYLDDVKVPVIASNGTWIGLDGRTVGTFVENQLFAWGNGSCGRRGDGTTTTVYSPVREFCSAADWCQVSVGNISAAAVKTSGELWAWGSNSLGILGDGTTTLRCSPVREFCSATDWCQVSVRNEHSAAVKTTGQIWAWASNANGSLGDGTTTTRCSPVREFCSDTNWCQVSVGDRNTVAIKTSGQIWAWGLNSFGNLGNGTSTSRCSPVREFCSDTNWCQVSAGEGHTIGIKISGELWGWGSNVCGGIGDGTKTNRCSPIREICSATNWCQISAGFHRTMAIKTSGELWGWGYNRCYSIGDGTYTHVCSPIREYCSATNWCQVSTAQLQSVAIKASGEIWGWGYNTGRLGDGTATHRCSPVREICSATDWCQVSTGPQITAAINAKTIVCR